MGHVFVSYSRRDKETVDKIVEKLEGAGLEIWIDRQDIRAGRQWRLEIVKAIDTAESFVLHLSESAAASNNVRKELDLAENATNAFVLPVLLEGIQIPAEMRYQLAGTQHIPYYLDPEKGYAELEQTLQDRHEEIALVSVPTPENRAVELVIKGVDLASFDAQKQAELLAFLSDLTGADPAALAITRVEEGSLHVYVKLPQDLAYELKAQALNDNPRLGEAGIEALRFVGDHHLISISGGPPMPTPPKVGGLGLAKLLLTLMIVVLTAILVFPPEDSVISPSATSNLRVTSTPIPADSATPNPTSTYTAIRMPTSTSTTTPTKTPSSTPSATAARISPTWTPTPTAYMLVVDPISAFGYPGWVNIRRGPGIINRPLFERSQNTLLEWHHECLWPDGAEYPWVKVGIGDDVGWIYGRFISPFPCD